MLKDVKSTIVMDEAIHNNGNNRRFGSAKRYYPAYVLRNKKKGFLLFTLSQIKIALDRGKKFEAFNATNEK